VVVAGHRLQETQQARPVHFRERFECRAVAGLGSLHQCLFSGVHR
jgi:hypothetical protein